MTFISHLVAADIWFFILWMIAMIAMVCFVCSCAAPAMHRAAPAAQGEDPR